MTNTNEVLMKKKNNNKLRFFSKTHHIREITIQCFYQIVNKLQNSQFILQQKWWITGYQWFKKGVKRWE